MRSEKQISQTPVTEQRIPLYQNGIYVLTIAITLQFAIFFPKSVEHLLTVALSQRVPQYNGGHRDPFA